MWIYIKKKESLLRIMLIINMDGDNSDKIYEKVINKLSRIVLNEVINKVKGLKRNLFVL